MTTKRDYYEILGISRDAQPEDVKKAFRKLAFAHHPDRSKASDAEARFKEINEAYEVLRDPDKRAAYDRYGHNGPNGDFGRGFEGFPGFTGFGDIFDAVFGGTGPRPGRSPRRGADIATAVNLTFEEAILGTKREVEITRLEACDLCRGSGSAAGSQPATCPTCKGSGEVRRSQQSLFGQYVNISVCNRCRGMGRIVVEPCGQCQGNGRVRHVRTLTVTIPAGVDNGNQVRLSGEGEAGFQGGSPGDLFIDLTVTPHPVFQRQRLDLLYPLSINIAQAALGIETVIPTLEGDQAIKAPAGVQSGQTIRLKARGVPDVHDPRRRGDIVIIVNVVVPDRLTEEQKKLLERLAALLPDPSDAGRKDDGDGKGIFDRIKSALGN